MFQMILYGIALMSLSIGVMHVRQRRATYVLVQQPGSGRHRA